MSPTIPEPAPLPPPMTAGQITAAGAPTLGAVVGSALGALIVAKLGTTDAVLGPSIVAAVTAGMTALFHWLGEKIGAPQLG